MLDVKQQRLLSTSHVSKNSQFIRLSLCLSVEIKNHEILSAEQVTDKPVACRVLTATSLLSVSTLIICSFLRDWHTVLFVSSGMLLKSKVQRYIDPLKYMLQNTGERIKTVTGSTDLARCHYLQSLPSMR